MDFSIQSLEGWSNLAHRMQGEQCSVCVGAAVQGVDAAGWGHKAGSSCSNVGQGLPNQCSSKTSSILQK